MATISLIAAIDENRGIGKNNKLPWNIPEDIKHFRDTTRGHPVIMGRKTFESIGRPLPKRTNIVITRDKTYKAYGCIVVHSLDEALDTAKKLVVAHPRRAHENNEIFIIGGGKIYKQAIDKADKLYLTIVEGTYDADTFFPDYSSFQKVLYKKRCENDHIYTFVTLSR